MTGQQLRSLNNIKRAVSQCDSAILADSARDESLASLCRGIEAAQKLRRSLLGESDSSIKKNSKKHFIDFIELTFPTKVVAVYGNPPHPTALLHPRYSEIVYEIRCKAVHENENLDAAQNPGCKIQVSWDLPEDYGGQTIGETHYVNGKMLVWRLRGMLATFVMSLDSIRSGIININLYPPIGSIRPD
jgi:hypothetical protein